MPNIKLPLRIDSGLQMRTLLTAELSGRKAEIDFKIDTGCNIILLSRLALGKFGKDISSKNYDEKGMIKGVIANGTTVNYVRLGDCSLIIKERIFCSVPAFCDLNAETNNLIGMSTFKLQKGRF